MLLEEFRSKVMNMRRKRGPMRMPSVCEDSLQAVRNQNMQKPECPICYEEIVQDYLQCKAEHKICLPCLQKIMRPAYNCNNKDCSGFSWTCPMCRTSCCLARPHLLVLVKGGRKKACETITSHVRCRGCHNAWIEYGSRAKEMCQVCK